MRNIVTYEESLKEKNRIYIDVRTREEHTEMTIPSSINLPIFTENERKIIGTEYMKGSKEKAKLLGITYAKDKLVSFELFEKYKNEGRKIYIFCSRGGFRSKSIVGLFSSLGFPIYQIKGGYKSYRNFINNNLNDLINSKSFISLYGYTGTGKTELLKKLEEKGYSILNLENLANHKGSLLGGVLEKPQPSQKMFESLLYESLLKSGSIIFTEGESRKIGSLYLPNALYDKLLSSTKIEVVSSLDSRIKRIFDDYVKDNDDELKEAIESLNRYISSKKVSLYKDLIDQKKYTDVIKNLIIYYYDIKYSTKEKNFYYSISSDDKYSLSELEDIYRKVQKGIICSEVV